MAQHAGSGVAISTRLGRAEAPQPRAPPLHSGTSHRLLLRTPDEADSEGNFRNNTNTLPPKTGRVGEGPCSGFRAGFCVSERIAGDSRTRSPSPTGFRPWTAAVTGADRPCAVKCATSSQRRERKPRSRRVKREKGRSHRRGPTRARPAERPRPADALPGQAGPRPRCLPRLPPVTFSKANGAAHVYFTQHSPPPTAINNLLFYLFQKWKTSINALRTTRARI